VHHPGDVVAGIALGLGGALAATAALMGPRYAF
jgi:membrane-associated phospholipid phosphatase